MTKTKNKIEYYIFSWKGLTNLIRFNHLILSEISRS